MIFFSIAYSSLFYNCTAFLSHIYSFIVIFVYFTTVNSSNFGIAGAGCFYPPPVLVGFSDKFYNTVNRILQYLCSVLLKKFIFFLDTEDAFIGEIYISQFILADCYVVLDYQFKLLIFKKILDILCTLW